MESLKRQDPTTEVAENGAQAEPASKRVKLDSEVTGTEDKSGSKSIDSHTEPNVAHAEDAGAKESRVKRKGHALIKEE
jgi:hypothetical protein